MLRVSLFIALTLFVSAVSAKSILVLGDSISAGYGIETGKGWVALLQQKFNQTKQPYTIFNESISGDTTAGGLARIDSALAKYKPDLVLLELGANDGLRGLSLKNMRQNLVQIIQRSKKSGANVLLLSMRIPPNYGKRYTEKFYALYPQLSKEMNIPYVPFILEDVALKEDMMQHDGLHPNTRAQPIIADKIWTHVQQVLSQLLN